MQAAVGPGCRSKAVLGICEAAGLGAVGRGTDRQGPGWEKLQADAALQLAQLARAMWNDLDVDEADGSVLDRGPDRRWWGHEGNGAEVAPAAPAGEPAEMPAQRGVM